MRTLKGKGVMAAIILCLCLSCSEKAVYNKFQSIADGDWNKVDEYYFKFAIADNSIPYNLSVQLRNSNLYPYQNIWLLCSQYKDDKLIQSDTIQYLLADEFGRWTGYGVSLYQSVIPLRRNYFFPDTGRYSINIRHGMRDEVLHGMEDVGLIVNCEL
jgi:gliding motility-associated lipoprotein GldH